MRSNLLTRGELAQNDAFKSDLALLFGLPPDKAEAVVRFVIAAAKVGSEVDRNKVIEDAAQEVGVPLATMKRAMAVAAYLVQFFLPATETQLDEPLDLVSDFIEIGALRTDQQDEATKLLLSLRDEAIDKLDLLVRERSHSQSTIPTLDSINGSVDLRMVFDKYFDHTMDLNDFYPKLLSSVPLLILRLEFSGEHKKEIVFQIDPRTLQVLIQHLQSFQRQINMACERYNINGSNYETISRGGIR